MELRHLQYFIALAETGQFTAAARRVNVVQSGLSVAVKELEQELGVLLVERSTRRVALTNAGRVFLAYARDTLANLEEGVQRVRSEAGVVQGTLRIGVLQSLHPYLNLPAILKSFHENYPEVEFIVRSPESDRMPELVRSGALDLAFQPQVRKQSMPGLRIRPFAEDYLVVIAAADGPLETKREVEPKDLASLPFVDLIPERALRKVVDRLSTKASLLRETRYEVSDVETLLDFVNGGLGVAIVPLALAENASRSRALKTCALRLDFAMMWHIAIVTRTQKNPLTANAPLRLFETALLDGQSLPEPLRKHRRPRGHHPQARKRSQKIG